MNLLQVPYENILEKRGLDTWRIEAYPGVGRSILVIKTPAPEPVGLVKELSGLHPAWKAKWEELQ